MASKIYDEKWLHDCLTQLAASVAARKLKGKGKGLIGLRTRGAILADRLQKIIREEHGQDLPIGYIDATMYRDDLHTGSGLKGILPSEVNFDINDTDVILVDDVISTGRSIRAAMGLLFDYGRPSSIGLTVLIDRGGRELPIMPEYRGVKIEIPKEGFVRLKLCEIDPQGDAVYVVGPGEPEP